MLEIKNVFKSYNGKDYACNNISLEVNEGDIFAFIGHNGAGKTTLIKCICGLLNFEAGEIIIDGANIKTSPKDAKRKIAYIPDNPEVYDSLSGLQFLNFIADCFDINEEDRKERIEKYAQAFDMTDNLSTMIKSYSHGMKQKIVIISALIHKPKLLVLDEPFVGLDPQASFVLKQLMHEMVNEGSAIFFSTHILDTAEKICNKVAVIKKGEIIKSGSMEEVKKDESLEDVFMELIEDAKENA